MKIINQNYVKETFTGYAYYRNNILIAIHEGDILEFNDCTINKGNILNDSKNIVGKVEFNNYSKSFVIDSNKGIIELKDIMLDYVNGILCII
jgi:hypothetical protein